MKLSEVLARRLDSIKAERVAVKDGGNTTGWIPTRLKAMDKWGGLTRKQVSLFGLSTGMGKSMLKWHFAWAAATMGYSVTVIDLEDPEERSADRLFSRETNIDSAKMKAGALTDAEVTRIAMATAEMEEWADLVEYFPGVRNGRDSLELFEEHPADLELFDYLSALPHGKHGREREISEFVWGWTKHCQDTDAAGVAFAQLKGEVSERGQRLYEMAKRKNPQATPFIDGFRGWDEEDLAWCTDAGRTTKDVGYGFRPGKILQRLGVKGAKDDVMEIDYPKRNWGPEGRVRLGIDLAHARFFDIKDKE